MNFSPYYIDEINAITRLPQVDLYMRRPRDIVGRTYAVPDFGGHSGDASKIYVDCDLPRWQWLGQQVPVSRFVILRELYTSSLIDALASLDGRPRSGLLVRMRMVNKDDSPFQHSYSVGVGAVKYAVTLQYGASGFRSFERFTEANSKTFDQCAGNLPPDLRRMPT